MGLVAKLLLSRIRMNSVSGANPCLSEDRRKCTVLV